MIAKPTDLRELYGTIHDMDALAQEGLAEIIAIAKLALAAMESPTNHPDMSTIARIFSTIWLKAEHLQSCIAGEANGVGCASEDEAATRRTKAFIESQKAV